jgi:hypothetical protein
MFSGRGIGTTEKHFGHRAFLPASSSPALNWAPHGHENVIAIDLSPSINQRPMRRPTLKPNRQETIIEREIRESEGSLHPLATVIGWG